ncbi:MAG: hypothetical protein IKB42_01945 [Clostridia bacterium]|nr:hypothetical protein [Clostridia bacterium]
MAIYSDIERERENGVHFIKYDLKEMHPDIPDEFSTDFVWCKYWVDGVNGGASKRDVYRKKCSKPR